MVTRALSLKPWCLIHSNIAQPSFPLAEERVVERSPNRRWGGESTRPALPPPDSYREPAPRIDSPERHFVRSPSLRLRRKEGGFYYLYFKHQLI